MQPSTTSADSFDALASAVKQELVTGCPAVACTRIGGIAAADPGNAEALHLKGLIEAFYGNFEDATRWLERALAVRPSEIKWRKDIAGCFAACGDWPSAARNFSKVLQSFPGDFTALAGYGRAMLESGDAPAALGSLEHALRIRPESYSASIVYARALSAVNRFDEGIDILIRLHETHPGRIEAARELARIYAAGRQFELARPWWQAVLRHTPADSEATDGLIRACWQTGDLEATLQLSEKVIETGRATATLRSFWVYSRIHESGHTWYSIRSACEAFGRELTPTAGRSFESSRSVKRIDARLRIGYLTGEFTAGPQAHFLLPLLENHDQQAFDIFLYHTRDKDDATTARFSRIANWRDCRGLDNDSTRRLIDADRVDILVDTSGFFPEHRLRIFAHRAAPIQITYPNCPVTTGVPAMDYIFTDRWTCPPGSERQYTEQPLFLPSGYLAYLPPVNSVDTIRLPAAENGSVTFGLFQRRSKMNTGVWDLASEILHGVPGSRLLIQHGDPKLDDPNSENRNRLLREFADRGIEDDRLRLIGARTHSESLACMAQADIALDTFPYQGQTTTCECLWQRVPVVALSGNYHVARVGSAILQRAGLSDLATCSPESYVRCAVDLANDLPRLADLRASMRDRLLSSTLLDGRNLAREIEQAYREVWRAWCRGEVRSA
ncbi:MAG TPA: tetratricopeptide repeat protein [Bryobacteraceae bacterium]|nr:tetratricopeptide repeat protein [Bryobacteraceae bacterium]